MARRVAYDAKRHSIVQSAQQILRDEGYSAATVERVIAVADISKGTFYHYFDSKDELVEAALLDVIDALSAGVLAELSARSGAGATDRLAAVLAIVRPETDRDERASRALAAVLFGADALEGLRTRAFTMLTRRLTPPVAGVLTDGVRAGVFTTPDPEVTAEMLVLLALSTRARVIALAPPAAAVREPAATPAAVRWIDGYLTTVERVLGLPSPTFARTRAGAVERGTS